jgi:hypothetical protein
MLKLNHWNRDWRRDSAEGLRFAMGESAAIPLVRFDAAAPRAAQPPNLDQE